MKANRFAKWAAIGLIGLAALDYSAKRVALNVMSNIGDNEMDAGVKLTHPSTYLMRGDYRGFICDSDNLKGDNVDLNAIYLGLQKNSLPLSKDKPASLTNSKETEFFSLKAYVDAPQLLMGTNLNLPKEGLDKIFNMKEGDCLSFDDVANPTQTIKRVAEEFTLADLHYYTLSFGRDSKGIYSSIYDKWDFAPNEGYLKVARKDKLLTTGAAILRMLGTPIHFYDRFYWKDYGYTNETLNFGGKINGK